MLLLEQDTTRKGQVDDKNIAELDIGNINGEYKVEGIWDSAVYARESESSYLLGFDYLISWKWYPEEENTQEPALTVDHPKKLFSLFYKDHSDKLIVTFLAIDTAPPMARPTAKPIKSHKWKQRRLTRCTIKRAKWGNKEKSESVWFLIEPEAGKRLKIYLPDARSVGKPAFW